MYCPAMAIVNGYCRTEKTGRLIKGKIIQKINKENYVKMISLGHLSAKVDQFMRVQKLYLWSYFRNHFPSKEHWIFTQKIVDCHP